MRIQRLVPILGTLWIVAAGCGKDAASPPAPMSLSQGEADDLAVRAVISLQMIGGDLEPALGGQPISVVGEPRVRPARASFDTTYTYQGLTYEANRTCYDADELALPGYGPTAARIHWTSHAYGTTMSDRDTSDVSRTAVLDVRGINSGQDTLRFDGGNADTLLTRFRSFDMQSMRYYYWVSGLTMSDVRVLKSTLQAGFQPRSGTLTLVASVDRLRSYNRSDIASHVNVTIVVTFNGTSQADVEVDGRYRYHWDIDTGAVVRA